MSVNKAKPHLFVLPEDDSNRQVANGFYLQVHYSRQRQMQVLKVAGGWHEVLSLFETVHALEMDRVSRRNMVLLIDFDGDPNRLEQAKSAVPERLSDRVFVLGAWTEPEALKRAALGSYEEIGAAMADDCRAGTDIAWGHELLRHNAAELDRLRERVRPILFE